MKKRVSSSDPKSPWHRAARRLGADSPRTTLDPTLRTICMNGDHAISVIAHRGGPSSAQVGTPLDAEAFVAWRVEGVSVFFHGDLPVSIELRCTPGAEVVATAEWGEHDLPS